MIRKIAGILAETKSIRGILEHPADLSEFRERPTPQLIAGLILIGFSYLIGWPAVTALSILAVYLQEPLIAIIGCPTTYGFSCVFFYRRLVLPRPALHGGCNTVCHWGTLPETPPLGVCQTFPPLYDDAVIHLFVSLSFTEWALNLSNMTERHLFLLPP